MAASSAPSAARDDNELDAWLDALYEQLEPSTGGCNAFDLWVSDTYKQNVQTDEAATYLTYGEVCGSSIATALMEGAGARANDVFLDLGSGSGRVVIAAAMLGLDAIGVEILPSLVALSRAVAANVADGPCLAQSLPRVTLKTDPLLQSCRARAVFYHGDFLQLEWWKNVFSDETAPSYDEHEVDSSSRLLLHEHLRVPLMPRPPNAPWPTIVFVGATKWGPTRNGPGLLPTIEKRLLRLPIGTKLIVTTHPLEAACVKQCPMAAESFRGGIPSAFCRFESAARGDPIPMTEEPVREHTHMAVHTKAVIQQQPQDQSTHDRDGVCGRIKRALNGSSNEAGVPTHAQEATVPVEIWCRELPTSWGAEIFRVYELRKFM